MLRNTVGVVVGGFVWMLLFMAVAIGLAQLWPDYAVHGREWFSQRIYTFPPGQSIANAAIWIVAEVAAGWIAATLAGRRGPGVVLAALVGLYMAYMHLYAEWPNLPWWYNLAVAIPAGPAVWFGSRLARPPRRATA